MSNRQDSPRAWSVAVAVSLANGVAFGIMYAFGSFFDAMASEFQSGKGATALVFSLTLLLFFGFGAISGPVADRFGPRPLLIVGTVLFCGGLVATSAVQSITWGYVTYSLGVGLGAGCFITPLIATVGGWFDRSRARALGLATVGSGLGTLILVPLAARLVDDYGWRRADLVLAGAAAVVLTLAILVIDRPPVPRPPAMRAHISAVSASPAFRVLCVSGLLMSLGLFLAFAFIVSFAKEDGIESGRAALLVGLVGASSVVGRLGLTSIAGRLGPVRLYQICLGVQPVAYLVWLISGGRYPLLVVFALLLGTSYGGYVALGPEVVAHLFGVTGLGSVLGLLYLASGVGGLVGPVAGGALADLTDGHAWPILAAFIATAVASVINLALPRQPVAPTEPSPTLLRP